MLDTAEANVRQVSLVDVIDCNPLVLVNFFIEWSGPCKMMKPVLHDLVAHFGDKVVVLHVNAEKNEQAVSRYKIAAAPTSLLFKYGKVVWRQSGVVAPDTLMQIVGLNLSTI